MRGRAGLDWRANLNGQAILRGRTYMCPYWNWCGPRKNMRHEGAWDEGRERREGRLIRICREIGKERERERETERERKIEGGEGGGKWQEGRGGREERRSGRREEKEEGGRGRRGGEEGREEERRREEGEEGREEERKREEGRGRGGRRRGEPHPERGRGPGRTAPEGAPWGFGAPCRRDAPAPGPPRRRPEAPGGPLPGPILRPNNNYSSGVRVQHD